MKHVLSTLSMVASTLYFGIGFYAYVQNQQSPLHRKFLQLSMFMTIWSFFYIFAYWASATSSFILFNKLAAVGWCFFPASILSFCLTLGGYKTAKSIKQWLLYVPALFFFILAVFGFDENGYSNQLIWNLFYRGNFIYSFSYLVSGMILTYVWGKKATKKHEKKQAKIIIYSSLIPFSAQLIMEEILPRFGVPTSFAAGHLYAAAMYLGVYYAILKYQFMKIPTEKINHELFEDMMDLALVVDVDGMIVKANKKFYDLLGYEQAAGAMVTAFLPVLWNDISAAHQQRRMEYTNLWISTNKKSMIPMRITITRICDEQGSDIAGYLILGQDNRLIYSLQHEIEQHKETMSELKRSETLMQTVVNMTPFAMILTRLSDNRILFANRKAEQLFQQPSGSMIGVDANSYYKTGVRKTLKEVLVQGRNIDEKEVEFVRANGSGFFGLITMRKENYQKEEVLISCIHDITEQRILLQNIAKSEELLRTVMNTISDIVLMTDLTGVITYGNQSAYELFGVAENKQLPRNITELFQIQQDAAAGETQSKFEGTKMSNFEFSYEPKQGKTMDFEIYRNMLLDEQNQEESIIYVMRDITERNLVKQKLNQSKVEIEAMNDKLLKTNHMLLEKSIRDGLTNLFNHQHINHLLEQEMARCKQSGEPLCLMMLDIDFFKRVNDTYGHQFGDHVLVALANIMKASIRSIDLPGRYGGEEFIIVLPQVGIKEAYQIAERIRQRVEQHVFEEHQMHVTISIGVCDMIAGLDDPKRLVNKADTMLYMAKENGRNRIEYSAESIKDN